MRKILFLTLLLLVCVSGLANGVIIVNSSTGEYLPLKNSEVNVEVRNQVATITSSQIFENTLGKSSKIKYGFPMPVDGAVTQLRWRVNEGEWQIANFSVENPKDNPGDGGAGTTHKSLTEYLGDTPLLFDFISPINENDEIEVELKYVQLLKYKFDKVTFEYPSDYSLIQTGVIVNAQTINFKLYSERAIEEIEMLNENPSITNDGNEANLTLSSYEASSLNDIKIIYQLKSDELGLITFSTFLDDGLNECDDLGNGFLGMVVEPESNANTAVIKKSFTLIIDESGSMRNGDKMNQAKQAASFIVNNLNFGDYFNIIAFDDNVNPFKSKPVEFNSQNKQDALSFISNLKALGATNISDPLTTAINQLDVVNKDKANIIVFFTDGGATIGETTTNGILKNVSDAVAIKETEIFLFTFGVGEDVTRDLLTRLGIENNGFVQFLDDDEIEDVISEFYLSIRNPVLIKPKITFTPDIIGGIYPDPLPNLYKGQQLILNGRYLTSGTTTINLSGKAFNNDVNYTYEINLADEMNLNNAFLPKLWAKSKIESLTIKYYSLPEGSSEAEEVKKEIEEISLCYKVLSQFTSLKDGGLNIEEFMSDSENTLKFIPNPFSKQTKTILKLDVAKQLVFKVYDINGNVVYEVTVNGVMGDNIIKWNGITTSGNEVSSGMYIYTLSNDRGILYSGKLIKK